MKKYDTNKFYYFLLYVGIIIIAFNLRPAITSIGPVISLIRDDLGLSNWSVGIITSLPLLAFASISPLVPMISRRYTNDRAVITGLFLLFLGIGLRSIAATTLLYIGTILVGIGIAICNVLLPGIIKERFPQKVEFVTGIYSLSMNSMAALASGLSIPIATGIKAGWQVALLIWSIPAFIAILNWLYLSKISEKKKKRSTLAIIRAKEKVKCGSPL